MCASEIFSKIERDLSVIFLVEWPPNPLVQALVARLSEQWVVVLVRPAGDQPNKIPEIRWQGRSVIEVEGLNSPALVELVRACAYVVTDLPLGQRLAVRLHKKCLSLVAPVDSVWEREARVMVADPQIEPCLIRFTELVHRRFRQWSIPQTNAEPPLVSA